MLSDSDGGNCTYRSSLPTISRTACCSMMPTPQVARMVSSGPIVEQAQHKALDDPADRGDHNEDRNETPQQSEPEIGLEQPGRVGAEHDELAMGEIDDAHRPVDDRQPQRHEQQDRSDAQALL